MSTTLTRSLVASAFVCSAVLAGCVQQGKYDLLEAENSQLRQEVAGQHRHAGVQQEKIENQQAQVGRLQGAIKYTVESDLLFPPGSWQMSDSGKRVISKMAKKLAPTQENKLVVNGYTDNEPIGPGLEKKGVESNQELSEKRAEAVKDFLISKGLDERKVEAVGHGEASPISTNETRKGRAQNRRVELSLGG